MHFHAEVWISEEALKEGRLESEVTRVLAPFDENLKVEQRVDGKDTYWVNPKAFWDWWQIGGTFDDTVKKWTHGKMGPGKRLVWPTHYAPVDMDILHVKHIPNDLTCYTLVTGLPSYQQVFHTEEWNGSNFKKTEFDGNVKKMLERLRINNGYLVTVDYHC